MQTDPLATYPAMMTAAQVAEFSGIKESTLFAWRRDGVGPPWVRWGPAKTGAVRYPREGIREYVAANTFSDVPAGQAVGT